MKERERERERKLVFTVYVCKIEVEEKGDCES